MNILSLNTFAWAIGLAAMLVSLTAPGQNEITGKYIRTEYPGGYLILNTDKSFQFRFGFDSQWDLACGQFEVKGDTLYFSYTSDMFDVICNNERINMTDTSDYFLRNGVDKRWRPIIARIEKNRIETIKTGDIHESETIDLNKYYYKREKKRQVPQSKP